MATNHSASLSDDLMAFLSDPAIKNKLLNGTLNLSSYSTTIDVELNTLENDCISMYRENSNTIQELSQSLEDCDLILHSLQEMLLGFSADLGGLSSDIKALQTESQSLGCKLVNRKKAVDLFREYLGRGVLSPTLCEVICNGTINDTFVDCVAEVERKWRYLKGESTDYTFGKLPKDIPSGKELLQQVSTLRSKAILRIRNYFLQSMAHLRKPKTNIRMIQINCLLKYSPLLEFILDDNLYIYNEIRNSYVESMSKTLVALFRTYAAQLSLVEDSVCSSKDVIAVDEASLKDVWSRVDMSKRGDAFSIGNRWAVLESFVERTASNTTTSTSASSFNGMGISKPIQAHLAISSNQKYPYEAIFKSILLHLMDSVTNEYVFTRQFFQEHGVDLFHIIFDKTLNFISEQVENHLFHCYDCIGLLLMIKVIRMQKRTMSLRKVDCLDDFFDSLEKLLWPRLKMAWDKQVKSLRDGDSKKLGMTNTEVVNPSAHYVSRRYAEFTCSILLILNKGIESTQTDVPISNLSDVKNPTLSLQPRNSITSSNASSNGTIRLSHRGATADTLLNDISVLQEEMMLLLHRLSERYSSNKMKIVFLINNIDHIISIFQERRVSGKEFNKFVDLLMQQRELFVEEELLQSFSKIIAFVHQTEQHMNEADRLNSKVTTEGQKLDINVQVVESLVHDFAANWKQGIELINRNVLSYFSNFRNGMEILKQVLTQLLLYYTRFQDIIRKVWRSKPPAFCKDLISTSVILAEIKKFALAI